MDKNLRNNKLQKTLEKIKFTTYSIFKQSWPIDWSHFQDSDVIVKAVLGASNIAKTVIIGAICGILLSISLFFYGFYIVTTKEVPDQGGDIREAVIDSTMSLFNPVTSYISDAEQRVNSMLYLPLYTVSYPDFLSTAKSQPTITPKLLAKAPTWENTTDKATDNYKKLKFTLRNDIKWSNGKAITINDVKYTFDLLKPTEANPGGNPQFKDLFRQITFNTLSDYEFELVSPTPSPQLIYNANFTPISREYFSGLNIERLNSDNRSVKPLVTSGYFTFNDGNITDPDSTKSQTIENPQKDSSNNFIKLVVLTRNPIQNMSTPVYADRYIFKTYYSLEDSGANASSSLARANKDGNVDFLSRSVSPSTGISPNSMKSTLNLNQIIAPSNTFYNLYLNIKKDQYFINQTLRKYVVCEFMKFNLDSSNTTSVDNLPRDRRILPIQFQQSLVSDCPENSDTVLDTRFYNITKTNNKKTINLYNEPITLSLAGVEESEPILNQVKTYFETIGFGISDLIKDNTKLEESIKTKSYNAIFLPITYTSNDPYSIYGTEGKNLSNINQNNKVLSYDLENNLKAYSASNLSDETAKNNIINFFSKEFVSVNLFRGKYEIDYSERIRQIDPNISQSLPLIITLPSDINLNLEQISFKSKRVKK